MDFDLIQETLEKRFEGHVIEVVTIPMAVPGIIRVHVGVDENAVFLFHYSTVAGAVLEEAGQDPHDMVYAMLEKEIAHFLGLESGNPPVSPPGSEWTKPEPRTLHLPPWMLN